MDAMIEQAMWAVGMPAAICAGLLALALFVPAFRRHAILADAACALCLPLAAFITFIVEKGLPTLPPEQKWLILPWTFLAGGMLGAGVSGAFGTRSPSVASLLAAAIAGGLAGWLLVLPDLDGLDARITLGLQVGVGVLVMAAIMRQARPVLTCTLIWGAGAALSLTLLASSNITLSLAAGAISATAAAAAMLLSIGAKSAPQGRLGVGAATGLACALVMLVVIGVRYDNSWDGIPQWRWWMCIAGPCVMLIVPFATTKGRVAAVLVGGLLPAAVTAWLAIEMVQDAMDVGF